MRTGVVIGLLLIVLGIVALTVQSFTFFTHDRVVDGGFFHIDVSKPHTVILNPIVGLVAIVAGLVLIATGRRSTAT